MIHVSILSLLLPMLTYADYSSCMGTTELGNIFDLSSLVMESGDGYKAPYSNGSEIVFNFCNDVPTTPCTPDATEVCISWATLGNCESYQDRGASMGSFGFFSGDSCFRLGGITGEDLGNDLEPSLIEWEDLADAEGLKLRYNYGDKCADNNDTNYELEINLLCDVNITSDPIFSESTYEECEASVTYTHAAGCPCDDCTTEPTMEPTKGPTLAPIGDDYDIEFSLYGEWTKYDFDDNLLIGFKVEVEKECSFVRYTFIQPQAADEMWTALGIGGDYDEDSSDEESSSHEEASSHDTDTDTASASADTDTDLMTGFSTTYHEESSSHEEGEGGAQMNGYCIVSFPATLDSDSVWETVLEPRVTPVASENQQLYDVEVLEDNGIRYTTVRRPYECPDDDEECDIFYQFVQGANEMIWAYGYSVGRVMMEHVEAHDDVIWLNGDGECGYAAKQTGSDSTNQEATDWMITAIVFIICFVIVLGVLGWFIYSTKDDQQRGKFSSVDNDGEENENLTS